MILKNHLFRIDLVFSTYLIIILINGHFADVLRLGRCPELKVQRNLIHHLFTGEWYEIAKNPMILLANTKCNKLSLSLDGPNFNLKSSSLLTTMGKEIVFEAIVVEEEPLANVGKLNIKYPLNLFRTNLTIPYWVLYTDYESALIWSCNDYLKIFHLEYFWILSRKPYLNEEKLNYLLDVLQLSGINVSQMIRTEQVGCN